MADEGPGVVVVSTAMPRGEAIGAPVRSVPFHSTPVTQSDITAMTAVLRSGWLTTGSEVAAFELELASRVGAEYAVAVNSATAALHLALEALGIGSGDEVVVPAYTFTATAEVVHYLGATPVLTDVDPRTLLLTADELERRRTVRTKAVMPVHVAGCGWEPTDLLAAARGAHLAVVEDAAHALPTQCGRDSAGTFGDAGAFSFYATKTLSTGEGGMLVTNRADIADRARLMSLHGITHGAADRYRIAGRWRYQVEEFGFKYNMTDLAAALGRSQLRRLDERREARNAIASRYDAAFAGRDDVELPYRAGGAADSWHLYILRLRLHTLRCGRDEVIDQLAARGIGTSVHFIPLHLHPVYQRRLGCRLGDFPIAEREYARSISLPIWPDMEPADVDAVVAGVEDVLRRNRR